MKNPGTQSTTNAYIFWEKINKSHTLDANKRLCVLHSSGEWKTFFYLYFIGVATLGFSSNSFFVMMMMIRLDEWMKKSKQVERLVELSANRIFLLLNDFIYWVLDWNSVNGHFIGRWHDIKFIKMVKVRGQSRKQSHSLAMNSIDWLNTIKGIHHKLLLTNNPTKPCEHNVHRL